MLSVTENTAYLIIIIIIIIIIAVAHRWALKPVNHTLVCVVRQRMHVVCIDYPAAEALPYNNVTVI